jgi:Uma2 family endonuclease
LIMVASSSKGTPSPESNSLPAATLPRVPRLENGDRLAACEFERRYDAMPGLKKAELIEGVTYVASPVTEDHAGPHMDLVVWLGMYKGLTPGVTGGADGTLRLDLKNRPQPDAYLRILETHGGQARLSEDRYVLGGPELTAEVAASTASYDVHDKAKVYRRNGVREYLVWRVDDRQVDWSLLRRGKYQPLPLGEDGILRSVILPGLWLDPAALIGGHMARVLEVLQRGLATPEHARFVARLSRTAARKA